MPWIGNPRPTSITAKIIALSLVVNFSVLIKSGVENLSKLITLALSENKFQVKFIQNCPNFLTFRAPSTWQCIRRCNTG